jgi:hypothetical protein
MSFWVLNRNFRSTAKVDGQGANGKVWELGTWREEGLMTRTRMLKRWNKGEMADKVKKREDKERGRKGTWKGGVPEDGARDEVGVNREGRRIPG